MDRFIGPTELDTQKDKTCLKSNMDRFIVRQFTKIPPAVFVFKIQYGQIYRTTVYKGQQHTEVV